MYNIGIRLSMLRIATVILKDIIYDWYISI